MYTRFSTLLSVAALIAVVAAAPSVPETQNGEPTQNGNPTHKGDPKCDNGEMQCCASTETATPARLTELGGQLGLTLLDVDGLLALNCVPITVTSTGDVQCTQKPVCCTKNDFNGKVNLGCVPLDLN